MLNYIWQNLYLSKFGALTIPSLDVTEQNRGAYVELETYYVNRTYVRERTQDCWSVCTQQSVDRM